METISIDALKISKPHSTMDKSQLYISSCIRLIQGNAEIE